MAAFNRAAFVFAAHYSPFAETKAREPILGPRRAHIANVRNGEASWHEGDTSETRTRGRISGNQLTTV
jgi:hypothetical protein